MDRCCHAGFVITDADCWFVESEVYEFACCVFRENGRTQETHEGSADVHVPVILASDPRTNILGHKSRHGEVARSSTRLQRRPAPISRLEWWTETVYRLLVLAYCTERCWVNLLFIIVTWISTSFNSCAQWYAHTYEQFLSMSVGLGLVFVHLFRFCIFWIFLV